MGTLWFWTLKLLVFFKGKWHRTMKDICFRSISLFLIKTFYTMSLLRKDILFIVGLLIFIMRTPYTRTIHLWLTLCRKIYICVCVCLCVCLDSISPLRHIYVNITDNLCRHIFVSILSNHRLVCLFFCFCFCFFYIRLEFANTFSVFNWFRFTFVSLSCISKNKIIYVGLTSTTLPWRLTMPLSDISSTAQHLKTYFCHTAELRKIKMPKTLQYWYDKKRNENYKIPRPFILKTNFLNSTKLILKPVLIYLNVFSSCCHK